MKSSSIRLIIITTLLACTGIILTQMFWVRRAYVLQEKTFNVKANAALRDVAADIAILQSAQPLRYSPVEQPQNDYFIVQPNGPVDKAVLQHYLATAFTRYDIFTDFEFGLYDCATGQLAYKDYYHMPNSGEQQTDGASGSFPVPKRDNMYFAVFFPHLQHFLDGKLLAWIVSSGVLLLIIGFLGYLLLIIFRQKRLGEIQKDFVANMTHEFKTPLSAIQLSANVLKNPKILTQPQRLLNYATIISNESAQLNAQIDRVLQMNTAEQRTIELSREAFIWQELIHDAVDTFNDRNPGLEKSIHLHLPLAPLPGFGDELHLKNVLTNLLDNAIKYCSIPPEVHLNLNSKPDGVSLTVRDNGIGIDARHQKFLFQKFYRVPTGNVHNVKGFGLGLNYVWLMMRAHNGSVQCHSVPGKGSTFTLHFNQSPAPKIQHYERPKQSKHPAGRG